MTNSHDASRGGRRARARRRHGGDGGLHPPHPHAAGHEIIRQGRRDLHLVRMTPDVVYDQLIGAGCADAPDLLVGRQPRRRLAAPLPRRRRERLAAAAARSRSTATPAWRRATPPAPRACRSACCAATSAPTCRDHTTRSGRSSARSPASADRRAGAQPRRRRSSTPSAPTARATSRSGAWSACRRRPCWPPSARSSPSRRSSTSCEPMPNASCCRPGCVTAVCEVPGGAHPSFAMGYSSRDNALLPRLGRDRQGPRQLHRSGSTRHVLGTADFAEYLTSDRASPAEEPADA